MACAKKAFTLIEAVLSIAISALVMLGCATLMFDMVNVLEYFERGWSLKKHADGVENFLRTSILNSEIADTSVLGTTYAFSSAKNIFIAPLPEDMNSSEYYLCFGEIKDKPLFLSHTGFSPAKICWIDFKDNALWLVWRFVVSESRLSEPAIYRTLLSPYVKEVGYFYKDSSKWVEESSIRTSTTDAKMPSYMKIVFDDGSGKTERIIYFSSHLDSQVAAQ